MNTSHPLIDIPVTQYYFDTFVVGVHHSVPHLIADLLKRKELALHYQTQEVPQLVRNEYKKLVGMINAKLETLNLEELNDLELAEPVFWVNELARRAAIEINTYGRIRPETLTLILCVDENDVVMIMKTAADITKKLMLISNLAESTVSPVPEKMPKVA